MGMKYRADIDGLRAVAVLAVILNHAGIGLFSGGYVGVDIFFVISGYLITSNLEREIEEKRFSILKFYEKRIRRIFPALFALLGGVSLLSLWLYSSDHLVEFSKSLLATTLFYSNFLFWSQAGYFDAASLSKPLLHTWSLAIEEQYYLFFPLLLISLQRHTASQRKVILISITALSFAFNLFGVYMLNDDRVTAFYLLPMRAWELLFGGLIALGVFPSKSNALIKNLASALGALWIGLSIFYYTDQTLFPGWFAVLPALGAGLIIWAGAGNFTELSWVGRLLSFRPIVFIGIISYSLYLWHWPIFVFAEYYSIVRLTSTEIFWLIALVFLIATLSWYFIEKPFRINSLYTQRQIYQLAAAVMLTFLLFGIVIYANRGFDSIPYFRLPKNPVSASVDFRKCSLANKNLAAETLCRLGTLSAERHPEFFLWGDSQAEALAYGVDLSAKKYGVTGHLAFLPACPPGLYDHDDSSNANECKLTSQFVLNYLKAHPEIRTVILFARWDIYPSHFSQEDYFFSGLKETVRRLDEINKRVVIVTESPIYEQDIPSSYFIALRTNRDINALIGKKTKKYLNESREFTNFTTLLKQEFSIDIIEPAQVLCNQKICPVVTDIKGDPIMLYSDTFHLSIPASMLVVSPLFDPLFESLQGQNNPSN